MDIGVLKGLKHPDCVIHTLEILFDHFPRFFMFFMIFDDCFSNFKALLQISRCFFLRAADLGSMAAQVPAGGEAKPHGQGDVVFRASDFSCRFDDWQKPANLVQFHILR